jgi:hypothetical protein
LANISSDAASAPDWEYPVVDSIAAGSNRQNSLGIASTPFAAPNNIKTNGIHDRQILALLGILDSAERWNAQNPVKNSGVPPLRGRAISYQRRMDDYESVDSEKIARRGASVWLGPRRTYSRPRLFPPLI